MPAIEETPLLIEEVATHVGVPPLIESTYPLVLGAIEPKVLVLLKYGRAFAAPVYSDEVAMVRVGAVPRSPHVPPEVRPRPNVGDVVATARKAVPAPLT